MEDDAIRTIIDELFPKATLLTPNIPETEYLSGIKINNEADILLAARKLQEKGCKAILIKGGHIPGVETVDRLFINENNPICLASPTVETFNTHGTGCTLSSAIAAYMALGHSLVEAVRLAKEYMNNALVHGANVCMGKGHGPVNHFFSPSALHKIRWNHE